LVDTVYSLFAVFVFVYMFIVNCQYLACYVMFSLPITMSKPVLGTTKSQCMYFDWIYCRYLQNTARWISLWSVSLQLGSKVYYVLTWHWTQGNHFYFSKIPRRAKS